MKKLLFISLIILLGLSSCITQKRCNQKFPPTVTVVTNDSIVYRDSIVEKIVEVPIIIKGDTVTKTETVYVDGNTGLVNSKPVHAETEFAEATAQVKDGDLNLTLIQKDTLFKVQAKAKESYYWKEKYLTEKTNSVIREVEDKKIPKFYTIMSYIGVISVTILIVYLIYKLKGKIWLR